MGCPSIPHAAQLFENGSVTITHTSRMHLLLLLNSKSLFGNPENGPFANCYVRQRSAWRPNFSQLPLQYGLTETNTLARSCIAVKLGNLWRIDSFECIDFQIIASLTRERPLEGVIFVGKHCGKVQTWSSCLVLQETNALLSRCYQ